MIHMGSLDGQIERRLLVNFRVQPEALRRHLPPPFEPQLIKGWAMAGICLIRLAHLRPFGLPAFCGASSENAAHRIAVSWRDGAEVRHGVYIPRRDTDSMINRVVGGRFFPGLHHQARFSVEDTEAGISVGMHSLDGSATVAVKGRPAAKLRAGSVFASLEQASEFFRRGSVGFSATARGDCHDGLELLTDAWRIEPLEVEAVESTFFGDEQLFPPGSVEFDSALIMRNVACHWQAQLPLVAAA